MFYQVSVTRKQWLIGTLSCWLLETNDELHI